MKSNGGPKQSDQKSKLDLKFTWIVLGAPKSIFSSNLTTVKKTIKISSETKKVHGQYPPKFKEYR